MDTAAFRMIAAKLYLRNGMNDPSPRMNASLM